MLIEENYLYREQGCTWRLNKVINDDSSRYEYVIILEYNTPRHYTY